MRTFRARSTALGRDRYLAPRQWGPVIGGEDIFTEAVGTVYGGRA
ncbi:hypothetical protein SGLAM104S_05892 [Streptomyces glaucescens]